MSKLLRVFLALGACVALVSPVSAAPLAPGATVTPTLLSSFKVGNPGADATLLSPNATVTLNFTNGYTLREEVVRDVATGKLDFLYQISRTGNGPITSFDVTHFVLVDTNVFQVKDVTRAASGGGVTFATGTTPVATDTRSAVLGNTITFTLDPDSPLGSGQSTYTQIVKTNATAFDRLGTATLSNGDTVTGVLAPVPVPEPATLVLWGGICVGLIGGMVWQWRRRTALAGSAG